METYHQTLHLQTLREFGTTKFGILSPGWMRIKNIVQWMIVMQAQKDNDPISPNWIRLPLLHGDVPTSPQEGHILAPSWNGKRFDADFFIDPRLAWLEYGYAYSIATPNDGVPEYGLFADFEKFVNEKFPGLMDERFTLEIEFVSEGKPYPYTAHHRLDK